VTIPRLYVDAPLAVGIDLELPQAQAQHVLRVLRLNAGAALVLFNGRGGEFGARITRAGSRGVQCLTESFESTAREPPISITLLQGLSRADRMDYTIQKAVELGVAAIAPVATRRSTIRLDRERASRRQAHWLGVIAAACEQCGRNLLPRLQPVMPLATALAAERASLRLVLDRDAGATLSSLSRPAQDVSLLVGPEGGLDPAEVASAVAAGHVAVRLGPRVLRTETAGVAAVAAIQALWGDLG
jgi:16S rRNA (uracil1498-N3)-methyltransferase